MTDLHSKLGDEIAKALAAEKAAKPRIGRNANVQEVAELTGLAAFRQIKFNRAYAVATDPEARLELGALAVAARSSKRSLVHVLEVISQIVPGFLQDRPEPVELLPLPVDKITGERVRNPWLPLPPRAGETTPHFDHRSQAMITEASPRLAKFLADAARNRGVSMAMLDELEAEKLEAEHLGKIPYGDKEWEQNKLRADVGATLTEQNLFAKGIADPWLLKFHRQEAKAGSPRLKFDNLTHRMAIYQRDPEVREVHKQAHEILKSWQAEREEKAA